MLGLLFTILTYGLVTAICLIVKTIYSKLKKSKPTSVAPTSKIYYITSDAKRKKPKRKKPDIAIKGSVVSEISQEESSALSEEN